MSGPFGSHQWMYASGGFYGFDIESSLRFNDDDSAYLTFTPASAGNRKTWTWSGWVKLGSLSGTQDQILFNAYSGSSAFFILGMRNAQFYWYDINGPDYGGFYSPLYRDPSSWYHVTFSFNSSGSWNTKLYVNGVDISSTFLNDYGTPSAEYEASVNQTIQHNIGLRPDSGGIYSDGYLAEVNFIDGTALDPTSFGETKEGIWIPKDTSGLTFGTNGFRLQFKDDAEVQGFNTVLWEGNGGTQSVTGTGFSPDFVWIKNRDNADDHYLYDTVRGPNNFLGSNTTTAEDYSSNDLNSFDSDGFTVGSDGGLNRDGQSIVAWAWDAGANNASTGHSSVIYEGSGSTSQRITGFPFSPDLVWLKCRGAAENHNLMDTVRGWGKRLKTNNTNAEETFSGGGFYPDGFAPETTSDDQNKNATTFVAWGWDAGDSDPASNTNGTITSTVKTNGDFSIISYQGTLADANIGHGLSAAPNFLIIKNLNRSAGTNWIVQHSSVDISKKLTLNATTAADAVGNIFGSTPTAMDATKFYVGNVNWVNNNVSNENDHIAYAWRNVTGKQQFGKYTGNASSTGPTVSLGFRPGLVMIKGLDRSSVWYVFDTSRQPFNDPTNYTDQYLLWNSSNAEYTNADDGKIEVTSTGFQIRASVSGMNASGEEYIYAAWAGSYSDFITDVNTTGSITSRVKANTTYGFSVVSYVGSGANATVGHSLGAAPSWIIVKNRDRSSNWHVWHNALAGTEFLELSSTAAKGTDAPSWNSTVPTSTVFSVGTSNSTNASGEDLIAYCWAEKSGYSKFGSYSGSSSEVTVDVGFNPAWVLIKNTSSAGFNWGIFDNTRNTDGTLDNPIYPNTSGAEETGYSNPPVTFDGNNIKVRGGDNGFNNTGQTYIYMAFADTRDAAFWLDSSGNNQDWQPVNLDHNDTVSDSPTNNFCTMNPIAKFGTPSAFTLADGNLDLTFTSSSGNDSAVGTMGVSSGKFYYEVELVSHADDANAGFTTAEALATETNTDGAAYYKSIGFQRGDRGVVWGSEPSPTQRFNTLQNGDVVGFALDLDANKLYIHVNGSDSPVATLDVPTDKGDTFIPCCGDDGGDAGQFRFNFGQQPFKYGPPE